MHLSIQRLKSLRLPRKYNLLKPMVPLRRYTKDDLSLNEKETIKRLLTNIGDKQEVELCLNYFTNTNKSAFCLIKVGGAVLTDQLQELASSLTFLHRVGLLPIVVHGAGPQLNKLLDKSNVEPVYNEGIRVTDNKTLEIARHVFQNENLKLVEALEEQGCRARPINGGVFIADYLNKEKYGNVGNVVEVDVSLIKSSVSAGAIPVLTSLAETKDGQILNVNADVAASMLSKSILPLKVVYLNEKGGLFHGETNELIKCINIDTDYENLLKEKWVKYGTKLKIVQIKELLDHLPPSSTVSIIKADSLAKELFTLNGVGTLFRKGHKIMHSIVKDIDDAVLNKIKNNFKVDQIEQYLNNENSEVFYDSSYQTFAVVQDIKELNSIRYISTIKSTKEAQLHNLKNQLWDKITNTYPNIVFTCNNNHNQNELNWCFDRSKGSFNLGNVTLFWTVNNQDNVEFITNIVNLFKTNKAYTQNNHSAKSCSAKRYYSTSNQNIGIGLIGARGHTGQELVKLIDNHPKLELKHISSRENKGKPLEIYRKEKIVYENISPKSLENYEDVDMWIMALPNTVGKPFVDSLDNFKPVNKKVILDLGADYRFNNSWWYGLSELYPLDNYVVKNKPTVRNVKGAKVTKISNPGCYATGSQCALFPIIEYLKKKDETYSLTPTVFGVSGYSGAGTKPSPNNDPNNLKDNLIPYKLHGHIHENEIMHHIKHNVYFTPHVASFFRGITLTISVPIPQTVAKDLDCEKLLNIYQEFYANHHLIQIKRDIPSIKDIQNKHGLSIGGFSIDKRGDSPRVVMVATLDNLLKGAATQAIQNINCCFGFNPLDGIVD